MANIPKYTKSLAVQRTAITSSADPTTILTADEDYDQIVKKIMVTTDDSSDQTFELYLDDAVHVDNMGKVLIPITAGTAVGKPPVDVVAELPEVFSELDNANNACLLIPAKLGLKAKLAAVTSGKTFWVWVFTEKYD